MKFCAYHQIEHPETEFNPTQLKRKNSSWCRSALAESKRNRENGLENNSRANGKGGRPRWDTEEDRINIKAWLDQGLSYSEIGRQFNPSKQAATISKLAKEQGWNLVKEEQEAIQRSRETINKICSECGEDKSIDQFDIRPDRKNQEGASKYFSKCRYCRVTVDGPKLKAYNKIYHQENADSIRANKRDYRKRFPEKIKAQGHKRRANKNVTRCEPFDERIIWESYNGLCYVCNKPVDILKRGQDSDSFSIEHIIPIIKKGPTSYNNLAVSHFGCNASKKHYRVPHIFKEENYSVQEILDRREVYQISIEKHYLHRQRSFSFVYGLYDGNNQLKGFVGFSSPTSNRTAKSVCASNPKLVIELSRLWIDPIAPVNAGSWLISRAIKQLPPRIIISYSDTSIQDERTSRYHDGLIYRALNFYYSGASAKTHEYIAENSRHVTKGTPKAIRVEVPSRHKYWTLSGNKRDKKQLFQLCQWPILIYEKEKPAKAGFSQDLS